MKKNAFCLKSLMVIGCLGWSLSGMAQTYEVDRNRVCFDRAPMPYADARSFVDLGYGYAKDRENVYLDGQVLEFVDPATFRLKGADKSQSHEHRDWQGHGRNHKGYHKTKFNVYYGDKKIDAMAASFKEMEGGYAKDAFNVFFYGKKLEGASAASFKILEGGYSKDAFNVYYYGKKVEGASASTFKYTGDGYGEDAFNAFYRGRKLE